MLRSKTGTRISSPCSSSHSRTGTSSPCGSRSSETRRSRTQRSTGPTATGKARSARRRTCTGATSPSCCSSTGHVSTSSQPRCSATSRRSRPCSKYTQRCATQRARTASRSPRTRPARFESSLRSGGGSFVERRPLDLARLEDLEPVAFLHVVEAVEEDAALEALRNLADVVLEPLQLRDRRRVDHCAVADHADARVTTDDAVGDHAAGDRAEPRDPEERAHLGLADRLLRRDGGELAHQRLLDLLGQLVDDVVGADLDAFTCRELARLG